MTFKEFIDKFGGMIIGIIIALLMIAFNLVYAATCIVLIIAFGWIGWYLQKNKEKAKENIKKFVDKL